MSFPPTLADLREAQRLLTERRGAGDVVAALTTAVGIVPCAGCHDRQEWLNNMLPLGTQKPDKQ